MQRTLIIAAPLLAWLCAVVPVPAMAQSHPATSDGSVIEAVPRASPQAGVASTSEHLFGDWGGVRTKLSDMGIFLSFDMISEFAGNVSGGTKQGATVAGQEALGVDIDWQRLAGISGFSTHMIIVNRWGGNDSHLFGDNLLPVQEIYGAGGDVAMHLVSAYAQQKLLDGRLDIAAGRMNVENDFASSPLYCNYMNNVLCGDPKALPGGDIGHSAYPDGVWGGRIHFRPTPTTYVTVGVYEVSQGLYGNDWRTGWEFDGAQDSGVYVPVEIGFEPRLGDAKLPGHYKIGFGYDTSGTYKDFSSVLTTPPGGTAPTHSGNTQIWLLADQMLVRNGPGDQDGIIALAGFIHNNPVNSVYADQYFVGAVDRGFWPTRPQDTIAVLFTYNTVSGQLGRVQAQEQELGLPFSNKATGVQTHEMLLEVNYNIHVFRFGFRTHVWF